MTATQEIVKLASSLPRQKEVALIILSDSADLHQAAQTLKKSGFINAPDQSALIAALESEGQSYIFLTTKNAKAIYDLCLQYPTGQITDFDQLTMVTKWVRPNYVKSGVVILCLLETLLACEQQGLFFRSVTGLTMNS